jgi:hypothetical protein
VNAVNAVTTVTVYIVDAVATLCIGVGQGLALVPER